MNAMKGSDHRPRLAYLTSQYPAPSHTFIRREVNGLRQQGWLVDTLSIRLPPSSNPSDSAADEARQTFYVLRQPLSAFAAASLSLLILHPLKCWRAIRLAVNHRAPGMRALLLAIAHFFEACLVARELQRRRIDHLHNHFANSAATVGMIAARLAGITWSFTMHGISETDYPAGLLLGRKIEKADAVVCASWYMRAQGLRTVSADRWDKMRVIRCGLELNQLPMQIRGRSDITSLLCVGRLSPEKGQAGLLQAYKILAISHPKLEVQLIGDGSSRKQLEQLAAELGISDRVNFLGVRSESSTIAEIANSDLLVLPSFLEGLPVVLMEAMALGVPVVATRVAGIPELIEDGKSGLLFTPSNWTELADRISYLVTDGQLRRKLADKARETVVTQFNVEKSASELSEVFMSVAKERRAHRAFAGVRLSFGLREAIAFSLLAIVIAVATAVRNDYSTSGPQPLPGRTVQSQR